MKKISMSTSKTVINKNQFCRLASAIGTGIYIASGAFCAFAAPSISTVGGTISNGQEVVITGSGFGTKSPAAPVLWAPFDGNLNPSSLGRIKSWTSNECVEYTPNGNSGGGVKTVDSCSRTGTANLGINIENVNYYFNTLGQKSYLFRKRFMDYANDTNLKSIEFQEYNNYTGANNIVFNHSSSQMISQNLTPSSYCYMSKSDTYKKWATEELVTQANTTAGGWAYIKWYINGSLAGDSDKDCWVSYRDSKGANMNYIMPVFHGDYNTSSGTMSSSPEYWDSIYIDNTWSRVIIGNSSTLASSTKREVQIPKTWSDGSISISFNSGAFTSGETAYVYVFDGNNTYNNTGYAIKIGNVSTNPPAAPAPTLNSITSK